MTGSKPPQMQPCCIGGGLLLGGGSFSEMGLTETLWFKMVMGGAP